MIWEVEGLHTNHETILPQGVTDIIFNFAETITGILPHATGSIKAPKCFLQGMQTRVMQASYSGGHRMLGIRLHPFRIIDLLGISPAELNDQCIDLTLLRPELGTIWHQLVELNSFAEKIAVLEKELPRLSNEFCIRTKTLSDLFISSNSEEFQTVDELSKQVCYSPRQLNRVSHNLFGLSAEELTLYKKFVQSVKLMHEEKTSLTQVAYKAGFFDQSHFCRVFKSYSGLTPGQYRKRKTLLPFHIQS